MTKPEQGATPRPWRVWDYFEISAHSPDDNAEIATVYQCGGIREADEAIANAELIVKAVNAHDALVEALRNVIATHCPNEKLFCGACTDARKLLPTETETGQ